jgi:hypothetical protein
MVQIGLRVRELAGRRRALHLRSLRALGWQGADGAGGTSAWTWPPSCSAGLSSDEPPFIFQTSAFAILAFIGAGPLEAERNGGCG